jgi:hypothetical protein
MNYERQVVYPGMCYIIPLALLRQTNKVDFHYVPTLLDDGISVIQRVVHEAGAMSPSVPGRDDIQPWYMHSHQEDNALVLSGEREVHLYTPEHGVKIFNATAEKLEHEGKVIFEGPHIFGWYNKVFHRPNSPEGSSAIFLIRHTEGFDIETEFNIYDLNVETGEYNVVRKGSEDQPNSAIKELGE